MPEKFKNREVKGQALSNSWGGRMQRVATRTPASREVRRSERKAWTPSAAPFTATRLSCPTTRTASCAWSASRHVPFVARQPPRSDLMTLEGFLKDVGIDRLLSCSGMTCGQACPNRSVEVRLRPPGADLWGGHKESAAELALLFMLLGAGVPTRPAAVLVDRAWRAGVGARVRISAHRRVVFVALDMRLRS